MEFHKIGFSSDHAGTAGRLYLMQVLQQRFSSLLVTDFGPAPSAGAVDYPDFVVEPANAVASRSLDGAIFLCGTGIGMAIAANKFPGIRAATVWDKTSCQMARQHNNINVLCLGARLLSQDLIGILAEIWLKTPFEGGRHERRLEKIADLER